MAKKMPLSPKFKAFLKHSAPVEVLEGTTAAGKTTVGAVKFMLQVLKSTKKQHILSGLDLGTIEKNIITKDYGILDVFAGVVEYYPNGKGGNSLPHMFIKDKIIYVLGYDNKARWKKALGSQNGCLYIDEANIADMEFVREASMRCDYLMMTLNPDDESLPIYKEYINHCRPLLKWSKDTPKEILDELKEPVKPGWTHWFFTFKDNAALTEDKINQIILNVPVGTKLYKNKIQGLRGKTTGIVFINFGKDNIRSIQDIYQAEQEGKYKFIQYTVGVDTSYSQKSEDTVSFILNGITSTGLLITLEEDVFNNKDTNIPFAPTDVIQRLVAFLDRHREQGRFARIVYIDSADQATITEANKIKREHGLIYDFVPAWKKLPIIDRINLQLGWIATGKYIVASHCVKHIREMETYSWDEKKDNTPEDKNDHTINANQYAWIPYKDKIGAKEG